MRAKTTDPYAPPPLKKDRLGPLVRGAIIAVLLVGVGAVAYSIIETPTRSLQQTADSGASGPQQLADSSYATREQPLPLAAPQTAPAPAPTPPSPAPRQHARDVAPAPVEEAAPPAPVETTPSPAPVQPLSPSTSGE